MTVVEGAQVGRVTAYLQGNLLTLNAAVNLTGLTFANDDIIFTLEGFKALGWFDAWAVSESNRSNMLKYYCRSERLIRFSAVGGTVTSPTGYYDFHVTFPVVPA